MIASVTTGCGSSPQSGKIDVGSMLDPFEEWVRVGVLTEQNSEHGRWLPEMDVIANTPTINKHTDDTIGERSSVHDDGVRIQQDDTHRPSSSSSAATRRKSACCISSVALASR